ncbi:ubiquinone biosynthesis accessory factor UbiJ [Georgfuchsia toluolica]|nr:hypothetical protein [Georgfuchsia toluolica]
MTASLFSAPLFSTPALAAINHVLDQAEWARRKLQPFAGRNVRIAMPPLSLAFAIDGDGRLQTSTASADLDIVLPAGTPLLALQGGEAVMQAVQVNGPVDLADALRLILRHLRWDIEEDLSKVVGDIAAHRIVSALDDFTRWQRQAARNLAENIGEYLVEENPTLVKPAAAGVFADDVKRLCSDLAVIEARITLLREKSS